MSKTIRTTFLDPDCRREPKTDYWCCRCQKDLPKDKPNRMVHVINGGMEILHPSDEAAYIPDDGDCGSFPIGPDCAKKIGIEWTYRPK